MSLRCFRFLFSFFLLLSFGLLSVHLWAQLPTATLNGNVTDPKDAAVVGARVAATNKATGVSRETTTGAEGLYVLTNLAPGTYDLRIEAQGFAAKEFKDVLLEVGRTFTLNAKLELAALGQTVTVSEITTGVELTTSTVQGQITATTVQNIPLNGRNYLELAFLLPGNRPATNYDPTKTNTLEVSSAGQFGRGNNLTVDGGSNNDAVVGGTLMNFPQDSVREFQIATNRYTAEVGHSSSSVINIVTKSGTNDLHASLFVFVRNKDLQARSAVEDRTKPKPRFDRQHFGGSVGGPIRKNRAWFFLSGEDRNQHAAVQVGERNFATQQVITTSASAPLDDLLTLARLDFKVTDKDDFYIRYGYNRSVEVANGSLAQPLGSAANRQSSLNRFNSFFGNWTRAISPSVVNALTFNANTFVNNIPAFLTNHDTLVTSGPYSGGVIDSSLTNELRFPTLQDGANFRIPQRTRFNTYEAKDDLTWTRGKHTWRFGTRLEKQIVDALFDLNGSSPISLTEDFATQDRNGDGVINDVDIPISRARESTAPVRPPTYPGYSNVSASLYIQDDFRVLSNLTLNLGARWDMDTNVFANNPPFGPCPLPLNVRPTQRCVWVRTLLGLNPNRDLSNVQPRLGFAWDPFKKGKTVIRGGYGIYYDPVVLEVDLLEGLLDGRILTRTDHSGSTCHNVSTGATQSCSAPGARFDTGTPTLKNVFVGAPTPSSAGLFIVDPNAAHPRVQQFTLGAQHQLGQSWIVSGDAIHDFGDHFFVGRILLDASGKFMSVTDPLTGLTTVVLNQATAGKTWYDGLLVSVQRRPSRILGLEKWQYMFNASYALSKSFNYANDDQIAFNVNDPVDIHFGVNNLRLEKGYTPTDERHRFTLYGVLNAPYDISVSPILTLGSSVPMDSVVPALGTRLPILARDGIGRSVKNGRELNVVIQQWNALAPCPSAGGVFPCRQGGILPLVNPNLSFGDKFASLDFRVTKRFTFQERHKIDVSAEAFNIFNVTNIRGFNNNNFSGRVNDITAANFYHATTTAGGFFGAGGPRAFQFAVRYSF